MCAANEEARRGRKRKGVDGLEGGGGGFLWMVFISARGLWVKGEKLGLGIMAKFSNSNNGDKGGYVLLST